jgi:hypothetical protein
MFHRKPAGLSPGQLLAHAAIAVATVFTLTGLTRLGKSHVRKGTPAAAQKRMRELLKAKQERDRQGPSYPTANAFTGRDVDPALEADRSGDVHQTAMPRKPSPDAVYGATYDHARGDQGKRSQKQ